MLGAVRNFYKPASLWIRTFMDIHGGLDQSTKKPTITGPIETDNTSNLFKNFAARFPGVGHISFIPFETKEQLEQAVNQTLSPITQPAQPTPPEIVTSDDDIRHDWMSAYDSHLDNDLAVDNDLESDHVADRLRPCRIDDTTASYGRSLELISDWYPTDEFLFAHDNTKFPVDDTLQHLMSGIGDTTDLSDALLTDMLDQGSELLSLQMGSLHPP
jgi:hypothetical protein